MKRTLYFITTLVLINAVSAGAADLDVYILTGQSNSLGTTNLEGANFDPGVHLADATTDFFWSNVSTASSDPNNVVLYGDSAGSIVPLQMQQGDGNSPSFWGPEFGLARTLFDSGSENVMVIKASRGGGGNGLWLPTTGHMYSHLLSQIDTGLAAAQASGHTISVKGFLYLQGESNNSVEAAVADTRLENLIDGVQSHINTNHNNAASAWYTVVGEIAASQSNATRIVTANLQRSLGRSSSQVAFIPTRDLGTKSDGIHFGRNSKLEIGQRFADAFNSRDWVEDPSVLAGYSAGQGTVNAVPHPLAQGLSTIGEGVPGVSLDRTNSGGTPAMRVVDNSRNASPGFRQSLEAEDYAQMFNKGWTFTTSARIVSGGGLALWSIAGADDPGWGIGSAAGSMAGFQLARINSDELEISLWQSQTPINLGPGSADLFHTFQLRGTAQSSLYDFYVDGVLQSTGHDITASADLAGFASSLFFHSGSAGGTGIEVHWNEVSLVAVPEPRSLILLASILAAVGLRQRTLPTL